MEPNGKGSFFEDEMLGDPMNTIKNPLLFLCD